MLKTMSKKIDLNDYGRLVKLKVLTEAFLLCNPEKNVEPHNWWSQVCRLSFNSKSYKKDMLIGLYGERLDKLFSGLDVNAYVGVISSFLVFHAGKYQIITTAEEAQRVMSLHSRRLSVRAVGIKIHKSYDRETRELGPAWEMTDRSSVVWYYKLKHVIPVEDVEQYNKVEVGDMLVFKKTQALVTKVKRVSRQKFYSTCSWTDKKITVLSGKQGKQVRLITSRPYEIIKHPEHVEIDG